MNGNVKQPNVLTGRVMGIPEIDDTLTIKGKCADAKATGDALSGKVNYTDTVDNLTTENAQKPLSARMGKYLRSLIKDKQTVTPGQVSSDVEYIYAKCVKKDGLVTFHFECSPMRTVEGGTTIYTGLPAPEKMVHFVAWYGSEPYRMYIAPTGECVLLTDTASTGADLAGIVTYMEV